MSTKEECEHMNFFTAARINRIEDNIGIFHIDISVKCTDCGVPLEFGGLPLGCSFQQPTVSMDGLTVALPATIQGKTMPKNLPGMVGAIQQTDKQLN